MGGLSYQRTYFKCAYENQALSTVQPPPSTSWIPKELTRLPLPLLPSPRGNLASFPDQTPKVKVKVQWVIQWCGSRASSHRLPSPWLSSPPWTQDMNSRPETALWEYPWMGNCVSEYSGWVFWCLVLFSIRVLFGKTFADSSAISLVYGTGPGSQKEPTPLRVSPWLSSAVQSPIAGRKAAGQVQNQGRALCWASLARRRKACFQQQPGGTWGGKERGQSLGVPKACGETSKADCRTSAWKMRIFKPLYLFPALKTKIM